MTYADPRISEHVVEEFKRQRDELLAQLRPVEHAGLQAFMGVPSLEDPTAIERWTVLIDPRSRKVRHIYKVIGPSALHARLPKPLR